MRKHYTTVEDAVLAVLGLEMQSVQALIHSWRAA
jgi:hypothetical protein